MSVMQGPNDDSADLTDATKQWLADEAAKTQAWLNENSPSGATRNTFTNWDLDGSYPFLPAAGQEHDDQVSHTTGFDRCYVDGDLCQSPEHHTATNKEADGS